MSATGRSEAAGTGVVRHPDDFYATPAWCTRSILPHLPPARSVLDPCCGDGAILDVVRTFWPSTERFGFEIDTNRAAMASQKHGITCMRLDALDPQYQWGNHDLILTNPPYALAMEFVQRAIASGAGYVAMLLRLNWLASQKRAAWMRAHTPSVYVLPRRPSFTGKGTDATEYAWMVWRRGDIPRVKILDVSP